MSLSLVWHFLVIIFMLCILAGLPQTWWWFLLIVPYQVVHDFNLSHFMDAVHFDRLIKVRYALLTLHGLWLSMLELAISKQLPLFPLLRLWHPVPGCPSVERGPPLALAQKPHTRLLPAPSMDALLISAGLCHSHLPLLTLTGPWLLSHRLLCRGDTSAQSGLWHSGPTQLPCPHPQMRTCAPPYIMD